MQHEGSRHAAAIAAAEDRTSAMECKQRKASNKVLDVQFELSIIATQLHADASTMPSHRKTCLPADIRSGKV